MAATISVKNLTKRFGNIIAVNDLSLTVQRGEVYGFIGPNGSGKTTTIKMMTGLYRPTRGTIVAGGYDMAKEPEKAKATFGYIPDEPFVYERMSGREFLYLVGALYKLSKQETGERIQELLKLFPIEGIVDEYAENYSRGNKQKLTICAALLPKPALLIIDEPIVGLDPESTRVVKGLLRDFVQTGGTVFMATHTLSFAQEACTKVGILKEGKLLVEGSIEELRQTAHSESQSLEELYLTLTQ